MLSYSQVGVISLIIVVLVIGQGVFIARSKAHDLQVSEILLLQTLAFLPLLWSAKLLRVAILTENGFDPIRLGIVGVVLLVLGLALMCSGFMAS